MANNFWKPQKAEPINAEMLARAYQQYVGRFTDYPDFIMLVDGKCPRCKANWVTPLTRCAECRFPEGL